MDTPSPQKHTGKSKGTHGGPHKKRKPISTDSGIVTDYPYDSMDSPTKAVAPKAVSPKKAVFLKKAVSPKKAVPPKKAARKAVSTLKKPVKPAVSRRFKVPPKKQNPKLSLATLSKVWDMQQY